MNQFTRLLYWKLATPEFVDLLPVPRVRVASGPFRGMRYVHDNQVGSISPRVLGTYELELHNCISEAAAIGFERIVDIGASDGYYAVGLARSGIGQVITAFEADEGSQRLLRKVAKLNGVDNIVVRGRCEITDLNAALCPAKRSLVICDVEGFEMELLDPTLVNGLLRACWSNCTTAFVLDYLTSSVGDLNAHTRSKR